MDAYTFCPGGCGKKIKFCCGAEVIADLEKIERMLAGEQRRACLEHIAKLPTKLREKPAILVAKMFAEVSAGATDAFKATAEELLKLRPENPVALALMGAAKIEEKQVRDGVTMLQRALEADPETITGIARILVTSALGESANQLLAAGHVAAARAHFQLFGSWSADEENPGAEALVGMERDMSVPMVWKDDPVVAPCPAEASYKEEYEAAGLLADEGHWQKAREKFEALAERHPNQVAIWRSIAAVRTFLADDEAAAEAFRKAASLDVPADDAVEFELHALALLTNEDNRPGAAARDDQSLPIEDLKVTLPVSDLDAVLPRMLDDARMLRAKTDLSSLATPEKPAPRDLFRLLDRPALQPSAWEDGAAANLKPEDIPNVIAEMFVFGRETDREARFEMAVQRPNLDAAMGLIKEVAAGAVGENIEETVVDSLGPTQAALMWQWFLPPEFPADQQARLQRAEYRRRLFEVWPNNKVRGGNGQTIAEAARGSDAQLKRTVQANILDLESNYRQTEDLGIFNELRSKLGLPVQNDVDPFRIDLDHISLLRLGRLPAELMPDEQLLMAFNLAASVRSPAAIRLGEAIVNSSSIDSERKALILLSLTRNTIDMERALDYLRRGRELHVASGKSPAFWLMEELAIRLSRPTRGGDVTRLIEEIMSHRKEPGVAQQLMSILAAFGIIDPAMMYNQPTRESTFSIGGMELRPQGAIPGAEAVGAGAGGEETKSGLWLPGMD